MVYWIGIAAILFLGVAAIIALGPDVPFWIVPATGAILAMAWGMLCFGMEWY